MLLLLLLGVLSAAEEEALQENAAPAASAAQTAPAGASATAAGDPPAALACPPDVEVHTDAGQAFATLALVATMGSTGQSHGPISKTAVNSLGGCEYKQSALACDV